MLFCLNSTDFIGTGFVKVTLTLLKSTIEEKPM